MIGIDSFHFKPDYAIFAPKVREHELRGGSNWELQYEKMSNARFGHSFTSAWMDTESGMRIKIFGPFIVSVEANASRLLTGNDHNGQIVRNQEELDQAIDRMWEILRGITTELSPFGAYTSVEVGGVIEEPLSTFEAMLSRRNLPGKRKAPCIRPGESLKFGVTKNAAISLGFYDKGKQMGRGIPAGKYTRIELRLHGDKLKEVFDGQEVSHLDHDRLAAAFYRHLYSMDPDGTAGVNNFDGSVAGVIALLLGCDNCVKNEEHVVDTWKRSRSSRTVRRVLKAADLINLAAGAVTLRELVPNDPPLPHVDLHPQPKAPKRS